MVLHGFGPSVRGWLVVPVIVTLALPQPIGAQAPGQPATPDAAFNQLERDLSGKAGQMEGTTDPNGNGVGLAVKESLVLTRDMYTRSLTAYRERLAALAKAPDAEKEKIIAQLRADAGAVQDAYTRFNSYGMNAFNPGVPENSMGAEKGNYQNTLARADEAEKAGNAAAADAIRKQAAGMRWAIYMKYREDFMKSLDRNPLLGSYIPGLAVDGDYLFSILRNKVDYLASNAEVRPLFDQHLAAAIKQMDDEIARVNGFTTVTQFWELGGPRYSRAQDAAAGIALAAGGDLATQLIAMLQAVHSGYAITKDEKDAVKNAWMDLGLGALGAITMFVPVVGPIVAAGITSVQIYRDGDNYVIALVENSQVQSAAPVLGYLKTIDSEDKLADARTKVIMTVGMAIMEYPGLKDALQQGKQGLVKVIRRTAPATAENGANAVSAATREASAVASGTSAATAGAPATKLLPDVERGIELARNARIPDADLKIAWARGQGVGAFDAQRELAGISHLDDVIATARRTGIPEAEIQAALARARTANTMQAWGVGVKRDLALAEIRARGGVFVAPAEDVQELKDFFKNAPAGSSITTTAGQDFASIAAKMRLAARGTPGIAFTQNELRLIRQHILTRGASVTALYGFDLETHEFFQFFDKQFLQDTEAVFGVRMGSESVGLMTGAPVDVMSLRPDQVSRLTDAQLRQITPKLFATLPEDLKTAVMQEALRRNQAAQSAARTVQGALGLGPNGTPLIAVGSGGRLTDEQFTLMSHLNPEQLATMPQEVQNAFMQDALRRLDAQKAADAARGVSNSSLGQSPLPAVQAPPTKTAVAAPPEGTLRLTPANTAAGDAKAFNGLDRLRPGEVNVTGFRPDQVSALTNGELGSISVEQLNALSPALKAAVQKEVIGRIRKETAAAAAVVTNGTTSLNVGSSAPPTNTAGSAPTATIDGTFVPAAAPYGDDFNYGSDAADYVSTKIDDLIDERKENQDDYGRAQTAADGTVTRTSKDGKTRIVGRARNGRITLQRFVLRPGPAATTPANSVAPASNSAANAAGSATPDPVTPAPHLGNTPTPSTTPDLGAGTSAELAEAIVKEGADPDTVNVSDSGDIVSGKTADGKTTITAIRGRDGRFTVSKHDNAPAPASPGASSAPTNGIAPIAAGAAGLSAAVPSTPACKSADSDCDALRQVAREQQAAADAAARALPRVQNELAAADADDRSANANHDQATKTYATAAGFAQLGDKDRAASLTDTAREFDEKGDVDSFTARLHRLSADLISRDASRTAAAASAAWAAYNECTKLPPCPEDTASTAPPGPVNMIPATPTGGGLAPDTGAICGTGDATCVDESDCGSDCIDMARGCESDGTCQSPVNLDLVHQLMFSAASTAMSAFSGDNDDHARNDTEPQALRALRALPRALAQWVRGSGRFANRSTPIDLAPGTLVAIDAPQRRSDAKTTKPAVALVATGSSTGDAFRLRVLDPAGKMRKVAMPEGTVLQPIKQPGTPSPAPPASAPSATPLGAFCLEFAKLPPSPGMLYQVAPEALQQKFKALRPVLQAVTRLQQLGLLHPDSNPKTYADSIKQYALWARIDHWDAKKFESSLVEMTKKNVAALKQNWTQTMEAAIRGAAPGRWRDIQAVLQQADALGAASAR